MKTQWLSLTMRPAWASVKNTNTPAWWPEALHLRQQLPGVTVTPLHHWASEKEETGRRFPGKATGGLTLVLLWPWFKTWNTQEKESEKPDFPAVDLWLMEPYPMSPILTFPSNRMEAITAPSSPGAVIRSPLQLCQQQQGNFRGSAQASTAHHRRDNPRLELRGLG